MEEEDGGAALLRLVEKATTSVEREVDPRLLKSIKSSVRSSDDNVRVAVGALMDKMKKDHSQVRYLALLIIDELFMRSKLFRTLLVVNFDQLLSLSVGFRRNAPLPPPSTIASLLRSKSIEFLEKWNDSFGFHYRQVRLGYHYLKDILKFQFPNRLENISRLQQERREREARSKEILLNKFENLRENFSSFKSEIHSTMQQIDECLDIIHAVDGECYQQSPLEDDESFEFHSSALRQIRLDSLRESTRISENSENKVVFDTLRELYKFTVSKHLPSVQEYLSILVRVDPPENRFRDSALKESIDIRNLIRETMKRCEESGLNLSSTVDEEDNLWEEGKIAACESKSSSSNAISHSHDVPLKINDASNGAISSSNKGKDPLGKGTSSDKPTKDSGTDPSLRSKLLTEAPLLKWSTFMDTWGSNGDALANHRGLEVENHWGRVDPDAVVPVGKIAELSYHVTTYKEPAAETRPCLAPLKKGGVCQRRDLRVCPFHGPIIPRDAEGNPLERRSKESGFAEHVVAEESSSKQRSTPLAGDDAPPNLGNDLVMELANQAVKNVRQQDNDAKVLKKAKLAKVRQHNEAVLREAGMASTSYSSILDEVDASAHQHHPGTSAKKPTLASMLRKKVTVKDRLSQKLLNARVTESTIKKLKEGEESRYREAYPNQW